MIQDPHLKQLADIFVSVVVRELQMQKPGDQSGSRIDVPIADEEGNDEVLSISTGISDR